MPNNLSILFVSLTIFSSLLSVSSMNWLGAWVGLELNMLSFVPLMISNTNVMSKESALKYFLIQASASAIFLMSCVLSAHLTATFFIAISSQPQNLLMTIPLMIKLASAPFHQWFILIIEGLDWWLTFTLMTWQKIAPLFILYFTFISTKLIVIFICLSLIVGSVGGLNPSSLRKIMAFSSVNHLGWLLSAMLISKLLMLLYLILYMFMNLFSTINLLNGPMFFLNHLPPRNNASLFTSILSLAGLPPLLGFFPKWSVLQPMASASSILLSFVMIMTTLITLYYYLQIIYNTLTLSFPLLKWNSFSAASLFLPPSNSVLMALTLTGLIFSNLFSS